jgi:predicted nucleotidyltransferase
MQRSRIPPLTPDLSPRTRPMSTLNLPDHCQIALPLESIKSFCQRWKIVRLELFGSAVRNQLTVASDLDFLYTFADDARWGWKFVDACEELEAIVGRPVDLVSRSSIERSANPFRKQAILSSAELVYEH